MDAKERILICLYETINKENGLIRPDQPTAVNAQRQPDQYEFQGNNTFGSGHNGPNDTPGKN